MTRLARFSDIDSNLQQQGAAIGVPEPVDGMHEDAERRGLQPFGAHCPLLEGQIRPIGRRDGSCAVFPSNAVNDVAAPTVQRIVGISGLFLKPRLEIRPMRGPGMPDKHNRFGCPAGWSGRRMVAVIEVEAAAQDQAGGAERSGYVLQ